MTTAGSGRRACPDGEAARVTHWRVSSLAGMALTGRFKPVCAIVHAMPDSRFRRGFVAAMDRLFEPGPLSAHPRHVADRRGGAGL